MVEGFCQVRVHRNCEHNFCDMARTLRMGENTFRRPCNFKELRVVKKSYAL
jgi:hypothetical protein